VVGPGRFSHIEGYMLHVIHPVILEYNRTTSKYPRKILVAVNISFMFVYAGCDQSVFWYATEHLCVCEKERGRGEGVWNSVSIVLYRVDTRPHRQL